MRILFINTTEPRCGVHQYGVNLASVLQTDQQLEVLYRTPSSLDEFLWMASEIKPDVVLYNWQAGVGGWMVNVPLPRMTFKQVLVYHDLDARFDDFDAVLFSDPTMKQTGNWHPIGRPLNLPHNLLLPEPDDSILTFGVNGFIGAWANIAFEEIARHYEHFRIRLHLPYAVYGDAAGNMANAAENACRAMMGPNMSLEVSHEFMEWPKLLAWLSRNHINCYMRYPGMHWRGVSSAPDAALCCNRPIAVNSCNAFRHLHDCDPSILVEHRPLTAILQSGLSPLVKKRQQWHPETVSCEVRLVLESIVK